MAFQPVPVHRRSLRKQIANVLEHPLDVVKTLWNEDSCAGREPPTREAYTDAANKCIDSATTFLDYARLFVEAKRAYDLWQKEIELDRVRKEISALKLVIPLLVESAVACQTEPYQVTAMSAPRALSLPLLGVQSSGAPFALLARLGVVANHSVKLAVTN